MPLTISERYRRPGDLPQRIPVFPLRGVILLPRASLPLNIFEPRYLAMVDDVMRGDRVIGVIQPVGSGDDAAESPPGKAVDLRRVGCAGRVTAYQELDDGRLVISISGVARFETLAEEPDGRPYRTMRVSYERFAGDLGAATGEQMVDREHLLRVLKSYLEANRLKADWQAIVAAPIEFLVNALSVMSPYGPEEKQALLEAADLKSRADVLVALAEMELAGGRGGGSTLQ
jgi:hypothetical protein